jgi:hypothetical protein
MQTVAEVAQDIGEAVIAAPPGPPEAAAESLGAVPVLGRGGSAIIDGLVDTGAPGIASVVIPGVNNPSPGGGGDTIPDIIDDIVDDVTDIIEDVVDDVTDVVDDVVGDVGDIVNVTDVVDQVVGDVTEMVDDLVGEVVATADAVTDVVDGLADEVVQLAGDVVGDVTEIADDLVGSVTGVVDDGVDNLTDSLGDELEAIGDSIPALPGSGLLDSVAQTVADPLGDLGGAGDDPFDGLAATTEDLFGEEDAPEFDVPGVDLLDTLFTTASDVAGGVGVPGLGSIEAVGDIAGIIPEAADLGALDEVGLTSSGGMLAFSDSTLGDLGADYLLGANGYTDPGLAFHADNSVLTSDASVDGGEIGSDASQDLDPSVGLDSDSDGTGLLANIGGQLAQACLLGHHAFL